MSSSSVLSPERRIEINSFDVDAWNLLLRESQARPIDQARPFYEKLVTQFPNAGRYWKAYIEHELRGKNFENVETLFSRCLVHVLNIELWKCYVYYVRETKGGLATFREKMAQAYDFALDKVGLDMHAYSIYADYISFLKTVPAVGMYAENQRITAVRRVYHRGIVTPMVNIEQLWSEYCAFEKSINATLAEKLISEKNKEYQQSKKMSKTLETTTRGINRQAVSVPPRGTNIEMKQLEMWKKYIHWEKTNPLETDDFAAFAKRVTYSYEQALLCLGYYPDMWYEASLWQKQSADELERKGDVKAAAQMRTDAVQLLERAIGGLMADSQLLFFAYADLEEERKQYDGVKKVYDKLLALPNVDPTLGYIQLMKFVRRTEGVKAARTVFKRAREDARSRFHVFVAAALMEYFCSKDGDIAKRVFDMGLKKYGDDPDYALAFVDFLAHLNEDNNTRVVFERILKGDMPTDKAGDIWDRYLEFESMVGDLTSTMKIDSRRREAMKALTSEEDIDATTIMLIDRYKFMNLVPCTPDQLKLMGYNKPIRTGVSNGMSASSHLPSASSAGPSGAGGPQSASVLMGGTGGVSIEISGYPRPDVEQMIPFKPRASAPHGAHPVPGGVFPPPPAAAELLRHLPPPWTFQGPYVAIDLLMDSLLKYEYKAPTVDPLTMPEPGSMLAPNLRVEDVKKEFYQLQATTTDPHIAMAMGVDGSRKRKAGGDSDSDEEGRVDSARDIYRRRMHGKV